MMLLLLSGLLLLYWRLRIITRTTITAAGRCSGRILASSSIPTTTVTSSKAGWLAFTGRKASKERKREGEGEREREGARERAEDCLRTYRLLP